jgi:hypothetical protein
MASATVTEVRAGFNPEQWQSWRSPSDQSNPAQLKRIVAEWVEQKEILGILATIDSNPSRALGQLLQAHALLKSAQVTITASTSPTQPEQATEDDSEEEWEDNTDEY